MTSDHQAIQEITYSIDACQEIVSYLSVPLDSSPHTYAHPVRTLRLSLSGGATSLHLDIHDKNDIERISRAWSNYLDALVLRPTTPALTVRAIFRLATE